MDVVVKEGGDATTGSSSHTMLLVGLVLVAAVAGGAAIWWFFFRKQKGGGGGGGPPKRENMQLAPGHRGIVEVLPDCTVLKGASDYTQAGRLCEMQTEDAGICKKGNDGSFSCVARTQDLGGGSAASFDACKAQCDTLNAQNPGSCYFADWHGGGGGLANSCLLRPLDASIQSSFCNWNGSSSRSNLWYAWAPEATNGDCPGLDQMFYAQNKTVGLVDNGLGIGVELQVGDETQCAAEVAQRTAAASKDKTQFVGSYSNGKCWIFQDTDPMANCLASAPPSFEGSPPGPSSYAIYSGQPLAKCPNSWAAVEKKGDLTCNFRLRPKNKVLSGGEISSLACMTACQDPTEDGDDLTFAQPASQFFPDVGECWCYDWPAVSGDDRAATVVFCSDQTDGNPRLSSKPQPPVIVNTEMTTVTQASAQPDAKCQDNTYLKPTCAASYNKSTSQYELNTYCDSPGHTEVITQLVSDEGTDGGIYCHCIETDVLSSFKGPLFPAWGLPYWSERPTSGPFLPLNTSASSCTSGTYLTCGAPNSKNNNQYCQLGAGQQPESSPCSIDDDCGSGNCVCGWYLGDNWERKDCSLTKLEDFKGCGVCGRPPPPPSAK